MQNLRTGEPLEFIETLEEPMTYIYIMNTADGKVKIGKTKNIKQRYLSLSGSNSQGNPITSVYCSAPTSLYTIERIMHDKLNIYRLKDTEWFEDKNDKTKESLFNKACYELGKLFASPNFEKINQIRLNAYDTTLCHLPKGIYDDEDDKLHKMSQETGADEKDEEVFAQI